MADLARGDVGSPAEPDLDTLVPEWLTVPEAAERLGVSVSRVRQLLREGELLAIPRGDRRVAHIPAAFLADDRVVKGLAGTLTLLHDASYDPAEAVRWLFTTDEGLAATPIEALGEGRGKQVRRHAQALGF